MRTRSGRFTGVSSLGRGALPRQKGASAQGPRRPFGSAHGAASEPSDLRGKRGGSSPSTEGCQRGLLGAARCMGDRACAWGLGRVRIATRLAQLRLAGPIRCQLPGPAPPGPGACSIPSSIRSARSGGEDRRHLAGGQRHRRWQRQRRRQRQRHEGPGFDGHRATARPIADRPKRAAVDERGSGHDRDDRGADRFTWEPAQRQ